MALTQDMVDFLELGVAHQVGACTHEGRPSVCRGLAARPEPDGRLLVVVSAESGFEVLAAIRETQRIALNLTLPENYRSMSFLGRDAVVAAGGGEFRELVLDRYRKFRDQMTKHGIPCTYVDAWYLRPDDDLIAVRFTPFLARNQTPGPDAGSALALRT